MKFLWCLQKFSSEIWTSVIKFEIYFEMWKFIIWNLIKTEQETEPNFKARVNIMAIYL